MIDFTFALLREANSRRQKEWDAGSVITLEYRGNELAGEVGEACNVVKKLARERLGIRGSRATVEQLADELADVIICADLIAMQAGFDLAWAVWRKFNSTSDKNGLRTLLRRSESTNYVTPHHEERSAPPPVECMPPYAPHAMVGEDCCLAFPDHMKEPPTAGECCKHHRTAAQGEEK